MSCITIHCTCGSTEQVDVPDADKRGVYCTSCGRLWDVSSDGTMHRSPLREARVTESYTIYEQSRGIQVNDD